MQSVIYRDADRCAEAIVDRIGRDLRLAIPISIGKPILLVDALYRLAEADRRVQLTIFTGLTLTRPRLRSSLERRFAKPLLDRLFAGCPEPLYATALREDRLPPNIRISEFFLLAGASLANKRTQRSYVSLNYSHVAGHLESADTNVFAQLVARHPDGSHVSLSSNTDVTLDMLAYISRRRAQKPTVFAAEINANLPYMPGEAELERAQFEVVLEPQDQHYGLFAPPKQTVSLSDYAMALYAASLVKDGGTLLDDAAERVVRRSLYPHARLAIEVVDGAPVPAITNGLAAFGGDLLAMGTHGRGRVQTALFGSVAQELLAASSCDVLVAKP